MEMVQKVMYMSVTAAAVLVCLLIAVVALPTVITAEWNQMDSVDPDKTLEGVRANAAYQAMYERYPDAIERINHNRHQIEVEVGVMNSDTGKQLVMRIYAHSEHSYDINVQCIDSLRDTKQYVDGLFANEFIKTTDCVSEP